ncbi:MAG: GNAT family N-acetyltransferase [Prevotellaceae bacterium]|jgi:ribosomal protein S18 acetylase RimI-like enzyme|nr:GNAT family N-acetyltransferase [Prevotellaceae bacterium]
MNEIVIDKIQNSDFNEVADILTDAFLTNPAYSLIFKNKNRRKEGLLWLFKANLFIINEKKALTNIVKDKKTSEIIGTYTLIPPNGINSSISTYLKVNIPRFILKFGTNALFRMLILDGINKKTLKKAIKTSDFYYLSMVAIRREYRRKGIGSEMINCAVRELVSLPLACNLVGLTTQLPENKTFYSRLGFVSLDEGCIDFKKDKYYNYNMTLNVLK